MSALRAILRYQTVSTESASPTRVLDDLLARLLADCRVAKVGLAAGDVAAKGKAIGHAAAIVAELIGALDQAAAPELTANLASLWGYVNDRLVAAHVDNDATAITDAERVVTTLREAFQHAAEHAR